jgi:PHD/YefM family antitoxin component YafN of YafNO toxin-antitoxin module
MLDMKPIRGENEWIDRPHAKMKEDRMVVVHPQYIVDEKQDRQAVLLPMAEWEQVVEELEELDDIRAYDEAKSGSQESVAFEQAVQEIQEGRDV